MANIYNTTATSKLDWAFPFHRTGAFPLDRTEIFNSLADAQLYAAGGADSRGDSGTAYVGQIISVVTNDTVVPYQIQNDGTLKALGGDISAIVGTLAGTETTLGEKVTVAEGSSTTLDAGTKYTTDEGATVLTADGTTSLPAGTVYQIVTETKIEGTGIAGTVSDPWEYIE